MTANSLDNPDTNDNRKYLYAPGSAVVREEYPIITEMISPSSNVIDLGCGDGSLLEKLIREKECRGIGFDISESGVEAARTKGLDVERREIDRRHEDIADKEFDYAICNVTLQMVMYPEILFSEMMRIARYQIVSFPNFGHIKNRLDLLLSGRMPRPMLFGYRWHNTGHIHQLSYRDFRELCQQMNASIIQTTSPELRKGLMRKIIARTAPNLFGSIIIVLTEEKSV